MSIFQGVTSLVDREDYLLGRKIDKTLELLNEEEKQSELGISQPKNHVEHECIPPSIRDYNKIQIGEQQVNINFCSCNSAYFICMCVVIGYFLALLSHKYKISIITI